MRLSSTCWRIPPSNCLRIRLAGALPGRKPGSLALAWNEETTFPVSLSTSSTGTEISKECLQPSSKAKRNSPRDQLDSNSIIASLPRVPQENSRSKPRGRLSQISDYGAWQADEAERPIGAFGDADARSYGNLDWRLPFPLAHD